METMLPTKRLKEICSNLGDKYCIRLFDGENVIYRDLHNGYDIEVSGLDNNRNTMSATIFVWDADKMHIVETIRNITSFEILSTTLEAISNKYLSLAQ